MYQRIHLECECGRQPAQVRDIGLTADRQLVVHWRCTQCRKHMYIIKPLSDYWRECPSQNHETDHRISYEDNDRRFLRSVGIRVPEDFKADVK